MTDRTPSLDLPGVRAREAVFRAAMARTSADARSPLGVRAVATSIAEAAAACCLEGDREEDVIEAFVGVIASPIFASWAWEKQARARLRDRARRRRAGQAEGGGA